MLRAAYLVRRADGEAFTAAVAGQQRAHPRLRLLCTGPWKLLHAPRDLDLFAREQPRLDDALTRRVNADPDNLERGLAQLVMTIVELLRQLMERQALRRATYA